MPKMVSTVVAETSGSLTKTDHGVVTRKYSLTIIDVKVSSFQCLVFYTTTWIISEKYCPAYLNTKYLIRSWNWILHNRLVSVETRQLTCRVAYLFRRENLSKLRKRTLNCAFVTIDVDDIRKAMSTFETFIMSRYCLLEIIYNVQREWMLFVDSFCYT